MPTVPQSLDPEAVANPQGMLTPPGPSQILQAAAVMHGLGRLGSASTSLGPAGTAGARGPRRMKSPKHAR